MYNKRVEEDVVIVLTHVDNLRVSSIP